MCNQVACSLPSFFECLLVLSAQDLNSRRAAVLWTGCCLRLLVLVSIRVLFLSRWYKGSSFSQSLAVLLLCFIIHVRKMFDEMSLRQ
jgi:hypothetical protein